MLIFDMKAKGIGGIKLCLKTVSKHLLNNKTTYIIDAHIAIFINNSAEYFSRVDIEELVNV